MKTTCPFCGITGEIPDRLESNPKSVRCRQYRIKFQPKPFVDDDSDGQAIDINGLVHEQQTGLRIKLDDGGYHPVRNTARKSMKVGPLKFVITIAAILLNRLFTTIAFGVLVDTHRVVNKVGDREAAIIRDNGNTFIQNQNDALSVFSYAILAMFFVMSMRLQGSVAIARNFEHR